MKKYIVVILSLITCVLHAQDIHFSQFYSAPFNINPALAGVYQGDFRVGAIHRSQWASATNPFVTSALYGDTKVLNVINDVDYVGIGGQLFTDKGAGAIRTNAMNLVGAYNTVLGNSDNNSLSFGIYLGYTQKSIDIANLKFENQFNDADFDATRDNGEIGTETSLNYMDFGTGINWSSNVSDKVSYMTGVGVMHINSPKETFLSDVNKLNMRFVVNGGLDVQLNDQISLHPKLAYYNQSSAQEVDVAALLGYKLPNNDDIKLYLGGSYRLSDAAIVLLGLDYKQWRAGFSYDVNVSTLNEITNSRGAWEISLMYIGITNPIIVKKQVKCIRI